MLQLQYSTVQYSTVQIYVCIIVECLPSPSEVTYRKFKYFCNAQHIDNLNLLTCLPLNTLCPNEFHTGFGDSSIFSSRKLREELTQLFILKSQTGYRLTTINFCMLIRFMKFFSISFFCLFGFVFAYYMFNSHNSVSSYSFL